MEEDLTKFSTEILYTELCKRVPGLESSFPQIHPANKVLYVTAEGAVTWTNGAGHRLSGMPFALIKQNCPHLEEEIKKQWREAYKRKYNSYPSGDYMPSGWL